MPYIIKKVDTGFKVCKRDEPSTCFSKKGIPKKRAERQLKAIGISESLRGGSSDYFLFFTNREKHKKDNFKRLTLKSKDAETLDKVKKILLTLLRKFKSPKSIIDNLKGLEYYKKTENKALFDNLYWFSMPTFRHNNDFTKVAYLYLNYRMNDEKARKFLDELGKRLNTVITDKTNNVWYPERPKELNEKYKNKIFITDEVINPRYPIYIISKGRWKSRYTVKYLEWCNIPYKIVVEPQEYDKYAEVIDKSKILILPKKYLNKNQGSIPARNFVLDHSRSKKDKKHWILDDNITVYHRFIDDVRTFVKSGVVFRCVEDYVDRFSNVLLAGHNYSKFVIPGTLHIKPIIKNTRIYSSILIDNSIPFRWRGKYNEDTDLSLRVLKAGYPTVLFNAFCAEKFTTLRSKGGNTDTIYAVEDALQLKADSLAKQHPDVAITTIKFNRVHHHVNYNKFKDLKLKLKSGVLEKLSEEPNNYGMRLVNGNYSVIERKNKLIGGAKPKNMELYNEVKEKVYEEQPKHSLYRSARIAKEYKKKGGEYEEDNKLGMNIPIWFNQKWISLNDYVRDIIKPCGSVNTEDKYGEYPLCRPLKIAESLTKPQIKKMIEEKNKLGKRPLLTSRILNTEKFNIKPTNTGMGKIDSYIVAIPSYNRPEILKNESLETLKRQGISNNKIIIFVADEKEKDIYKKAIGNNYKMVVGEKGYDKQFNFIIDYFRENQPIILFQDDIKSVFKRVGGKGSHNKEEINLDTFFNQAFRDLKDNNLNLWGINKVSNPFLMTDGKTTDLRLIIGGMFGFFNKKDNKYRNSIKDNYTAEDIERTIKFFQNDGGVLRYNDIGIISPPIVRKGGFSTDLGGIDNRIKKSIEASYLIKKLYPKYGEVVDNKRQGKVFKLHRLKSFHVIGNGKDKFIKQLEKIGLHPEAYLEIAKRVAKREGYDPNKLSLSLNNDNKLKYDSPEGLKYFGKAGYGDYIIWLYKQSKGEVPDGYANKKRNVFRKSHGAMSKIHKLGKYSPNELAINIIW